MNKKNIAGLSFRGGKKDNFYLCNLEYFSDSNRWFLNSLLQVKDVDENDGNDALHRWIAEYELKQMVVDFPLSSPYCHNCTLFCPGIDNCPVEEVRDVRDKISEILEEDSRLMQENPKKYEQERNLDDEIDYSRDILAKEPSAHMLSRSFRRKLKKGFVPYWNRSLDFWVWSYYYDLLLKLFNISYDSFGNSSLMLFFRFQYLRRHFPTSLELFESNNYITLIELLRSKVILKKDILNLTDITLARDARYIIIKAIEKYLNIFIYDKDLEILSESPLAFQSFLLAIAGQRFYVKSCRELPLWANSSKTNFLAPQF